MRKNPYGKILKWEPKEQYLSTVPKSCSFIKNAKSCQKKKKRATSMFT